MIYRPKYFPLQELVHPDIYTAYGERCWELLDGEALRVIDSLRMKFGAIVINNWNAGGEFKDSGLRLFDSKTGVLYSQHKYGRAFDCKFKAVKVREVADYLLGHQAEFPSLTTIEDPDATKTWLHCDTRNNEKSGIRIVSP